MRAVDNQDTAAERLPEQVAVAALAAAAVRDGAVELDEDGGELTGTVCSLRHDLVGDPDAAVAYSNQAAVPPKWTPSRSSPASAAAP